MKLRQDAWVKENDEVLAQAVIRHVKEGSTQLNAFEEAADLLNRTAAACGFRWNAVVRKQYDEALNEAKLARKEKMRVIQSVKKRTTPFYYSSDEGNGRQQPIALSSLSLDIVIAYLMRLQQHSEHGDSLKWRHIASSATEKIKQLEQQIEQLQKENKEIKHDYEQFVQIMNRARKLVAFDSVEEPTLPTFKMERNGNLVANYTTNTTGETNTEDELS